MTSLKDLPPPEDAAPTDAKLQAASSPSPKKRSKLSLVLIVLSVVVLGPAISVGIWFSMGKSLPVASEPGKPIPPEPPAPPPAFKTTLASADASVLSSEGNDSLAKMADKISSLAAGLPPELLLASVDGTAPSRLIVSGNLERPVDAISRIPRHERWEIRIGAGNTSDSYTRQLDYFKMELGVIGQASDIVYLSNLSAPNPTAKTQSAAGEKRLYLIWQRGSMREADEEILSRAKISSTGKVVVHFCPVELENELVKLEDDQAKQAGLKRIRKTVFGVRPKEPEGFRFFVVEQKADEQPDEREWQRPHKKFLDHLASNNLIPPEVLESLRRQVAKATKPVQPGTLARLLVDHGHLTETQGERLAGGPLPASKKSASHSGVLGLEPLGQTPAKPANVPSKSQAEIATKPATPAKAAAATQAKPMEKLASVDDLMALEELPSTATKPAAKASPSTTTKAKPATSASPSTIAKAKPLSAPAPLMEGLAPLPGDDLFGAGASADPFASPSPILLDASASLDDPLAAANPLAPASKKPAAQLAAAPRKKSKVLPIIAIVVILLLVVGGVAGYALTRSNGDQEFELAEQDYTAKTYDAAVTKFSTFLEDFPANSRVSTARLHRGMAKILAASPTKDNFTAILPAAKATLTEIGGEKDISQLHAELAPLLMDMAATLAEQARQGKTAAESSEKLAQAKDALALANDGRFVPGSLRQWQRLADVEESLALLERELGRGKTFEGVLAEIKKSAEGGKLDTALAERTKLLLAYPELAGDIGLRELGKQIGKSVAAQVKTAADSSKGESSEAKSPVLASLSLASGKPTTAAETPGQTFFALAAGSVWALDGGTGKLLWSRPVGRNSGSAVTTLSADAGSDVVLADLFRNEVLCVNPRSGALRWRHPLKEPLTGEPLVIDGQVVVATTTGKIVAFDAQNGDGKFSAQLPQGVRLGPAGVSSKVFAVAQHSFLYVLSSNLKCEAAVYLGHDADTVETPPTILSGHVIVAENRPATSLLHVIALDEKGLAAGPSQLVEVAGLVSTPPVRLGERLLVLTDQQSVAFDYQPGADEPLNKLGETQASSTSRLVRFGAVHADKLWVADDGLRRFDFLPAGGSLKEAWIGFAGETLEAPPHGTADAIFCVRRVAGRPGVIATALKAPSGMALWETHLAQPLDLLTVSSDGQSAVATTTSSADVKVDLASLSGSQVQFAAEANAASSVPGDSLAAPTFVWSGGKLRITTSGSVELLDEKTAAPLGEPFQLSIRPGVALANCSAASTGSEGENIVICDGATSVYLLRLEKAPQPGPALVAKATLKVPALSRIAALDAAAYVVDAAGTVQVLPFPELKAKGGAKLDCRAVVSGPFAAGKHVLLETDKGELVCLDAAGKQAWRITLSDGPLAGSPLVTGGDFLLPLRSGTLLRVAAANGKEMASANLGQPLAGSPVLAGSAALVPTAAGGILKVAIPEKK